MYKSPEENVVKVTQKIVMGRYLTLYYDCGNENCKKERFHEVRDINWNFNERGLCNWIQDNYRFHHGGEEPEITFYRVTSDYHYTRQQFYDTVKHYWKALKHNLRSGNCYIFPSPNEKVPMTKKDNGFYEEWCKDLIDFAKEYYSNRKLLLWIY